MPPLILRRLLRLAPLLAFVAAGCDETGDPPVESPTLVALVVIDQLGAGLLERYDTLFTGGLRRILDEGRVYPGSSHRHAVTSTAPGHATLATGTVPARHGVVANDHFELLPDSTLWWRYAVVDTTSPVVGFPGLEGRSPRALLRDGLADWARAADPAARVLSVSAKDRAAITLGGRGAGEGVHVYWLSVPGRRFVTSAFYRDRYPGWVERFNRERTEALLADTVWESVVPPAWRALARPDSSPWEGDGVHVTFPHRITDVGEGSLDRADWIEDTPFPDRAVLDFVRMGVDSLQLGRRGVVDVLSVAFSQTDYVGHEYGPHSQEQLDNLLRLDEVLDELLTLLDARVGPGRWILGLSSDHGVMEIPEHKADGGPPGGRSPSDAEVLMARRVQEFALPGLTLEAFADSARTALEAFPWVAEVFVGSELGGTTADGGPPAPFRDPPAAAGDSFAALYRASYHPDRRVFPARTIPLMIREREGTYVDNELLGTGHGSPYWYDRWVPVVVMGPGVVPGRATGPAFTVDLAPTLAALGGFPIPDDLDGSPRGVRESR
jgi:hypothetical protein